jgi:hypothetical protein
MFLLSLVCALLCACKAHAEGLHCSSGEIPIRAANATAAKCTPIHPADSLAAMKWLVTTTAMCPENAPSEKVLDMYPSCSLQEKPSCSILILEDMTLCHPSVDLVVHWFAKNCTVNYIPINIPTWCTRQVLSPKLHQAHVQAALATMKSDHADILYILSGHAMRQSKSANMFGSVLDKLKVVVDQVVLLLDYSCKNIRGYGNEDSFPGRAFNTIHYFLNGGGGNFLNVGTLATPGDNSTHSRCFKGNVLCTVHTGTQIFVFSILLLTFVHIVYITTEMFNVANISTEVGSYVTTFKRITEQHVPVQLVSPEFANTVDTTLAKAIEVGMQLPPHCIISSNSSEVELMHAWILLMLSEKCITMMGMHNIGCKQYAHVDPLTPFLIEVVHTLAVEYAWSQGWCFVRKGLTDIPTFPDSEEQMKQLVHYSKTRKRSEVRTRSTSTVRLVFMITAYIDVPQVMRLLSRLYSPNHYYVVVVDKSHDVVVANLTEQVKALGENVVVVTPMAVVYLASSATRILAQGMAWILQRLDDWDYLVALTGSDYPLQNLSEIEKTLSLRQPPAPSMLMWGVRGPYGAALKKDFENATKKRYADEATLRMQEERTTGLLSERRGTEQFGIPLTSENQRILMRYSARQTSQVFLFPHSSSKYEYSFFF